MNSTRLNGRAQPRDPVGLVGWSDLLDAFRSSDNQKRHIWNYIENQDDDLENPKEPIENQAEGFSGKGKPFALRTVHEIRGQCVRGEPEGHQGHIDDGAPHEESC